MTKTKQVRFYFHKVVHEGEQIDLSTVFDEVALKYRDSPDRYTFQLSDDKKYKLERLTPPNDMEPYYHLVVEELRDFNFPSKTRLNGESQDLGLEEDEFLGEKMSALYDSENALFMLQVNRNSISTNKFEFFLSTLLDELNYKCDIRLPVIIQSDAERVARSFTGYKHVAIKMGQDTKPTDNFDLISIIQNAISSDKDSNLFDIEISLTAKKDKNKNGEYLPDSIVREVMSIDRNGVKKLNVRGRNYDDRLETVDLISNKLMEVIRFQYDEKRTLNPVSVFSEMSLRYSDVKYKVLRNR